MHGGHAPVGGTVQSLNRILTAAIALFAITALAKGQFEATEACGRRAAN